MSDIQNPGYLNVSSVTLGQGQQREDGTRTVDSRQKGADLQSLPERQDGEEKAPLGDLEPLDYYRADDPEALAKAIERIESFMQRVSRDLEFQVDDETGKTVVTVYVRGTDQVVRQIPPEEMLEVAERMREVQGVLFNGEA